MKYLGIDYGTRRIGVAVSDESATLAFPLGVVAAGTTALKEVCDIAKENAVVGVVMGESKNYGGEANPVMKEVEKFKEALEAEGLNVMYEPEFMSSMAAARQFAPSESREDGRKKNPNQELLDASAAALILQNFLDRNRKREFEVE
ncbi:Holliday junction resolvase RuvX [Patescibacteria group bacterium]|nr:Holliday junction resolvase RuvX [Patescibacteria group bacterium]